jgi:mannose-1-phosphate guanylyltransferase
MSNIALTKSDEIYCIILAGGNGERLWPLSRAKKPKQLLTLGTKTLLEQTIDRAALITDQSHLWVITTKAQEALVHKNIYNRIGQLLLEPEGRNTGPAIISTCLRLYEQNPNALVLFMPADSFIPESSYLIFIEKIQQAIAYASMHNHIILIGLTPTYPATGYGYMSYQKTQDCAYPICAFHEKPTLMTAQAYIKETTMLWNVGIFCASVQVFLNECKQYAPVLYNDVCAFYRGEKEYNQLPSISIDYALMEKSKNLMVIPADFVWSDVGNVYTFTHLKKQQRNDNQYIAVDAQNNIVDVPNKLVALIGVDDLCVVETEDALLIVKQDEAEKVRAVVQELKCTGKVEYL